MSRSVGDWPSIRTVSLLSTGFVLCVLLATLLVLAGVWWLWNRWPRRLAALGRAASLLVVMALGATLAGTLVNRSFAFYASVEDLLGSAAASRQAPPPSFSVSREQGRLTILTPGWRHLVAQRAAVGRGTVLTVEYGGTLTGISRVGALYLPAAYLVGRSVTSFPVVELFHGYPGSTNGFTRQLSIGTVLDSEISAHRLPPVIAAIPQTYEGGRVSECVDAVHGQRNESYLAVDVPADVDSAFRVEPGRSFATLGYSDGAFCAVNLGLHHPDRYAAAASLSGYFTAGLDRGALALYAGGHGARQRNSPLWWVQHRSPTAPALFLNASREDSFSVRQEAGFRAAVRAHAHQLPLSATLLPAGGHNFGTWQVALGPALDFLGRYLPAPLAAPLELPPLP